MTDGGSTGSARRHLPWLLAFMVLVWSLNFIVAKHALGQFPPPLLGALRFTAGGLVILPVFLWRGGASRLPAAPAALKLLALGVLGVGLNQIVFLLGLSRTTVAHASLIYALMPVMVLFLSARAGHERITSAKLGGLALALAGVGVLQGRALFGGHGSVAGDLFVLASGLTFAVYTVAGRQIRERYDGLTINTFGFLGSAVVLAPLTAWLAWRSDWSKVTWAGWTAVVYMAVFPSVVAYLIYSYALQHMPSSKVSRLVYLQPFLATLFAVPLLGERVTPSLAAGGALVLAGVFWAERG